MKTRLMTVLTALLPVVWLSASKQALVAQTPITNMVWIPAGTFVMGDMLNDGGTIEKPVHLVYVSSYYMDKYEVTKALWDEVFFWATNHGYNFEGIARGKAADHPAHSMRWYDGVKWCNARSEKEDRVPAYYIDVEQATVYRTGAANIRNEWVKWNSGYRLPTEAEWERAAQGGASGHRFPWSNTDTITHSQANYSSSSLWWYDVSPTRGEHPTFRVGTTPYSSPVGFFEPNGFGLYDMAGNVWEWCWDWYGNYSSDSQADPRGPAVGISRIVRGGAWFYAATYCRTSYRGGYSPSWNNDNNLGFRTVIIPTIPEWRQAIETQPPAPTYSPCPDKLPGKDSLIVVTHGRNPNTNWVVEMTNAITHYLTDNGLGNWQVHAHWWVEKARTNLFDVLVTAEQEGVKLSRCLTNDQWAHIHFIAHSAGATLIQVAMEIIKSNSLNVAVHTTFLDAFVGFNQAGITRYGKGADWSDSYFTRDLLTGGEVWQLTQGSLDWCYNVDTTWLDPQKSKVDGFISKSGGVNESCRVTKTMHDWPHVFYNNTLTGNITADYEGFGFPLSKEGGNWDYATNHYPVGNMTPHPLGIPDLPCSESLYISTPAVIGPTVNFLEYLSAGLSDTGYIQKYQNALQLFPGSPVWIATIVNLTNPVNSLSFDAMFVSTNTESGGLLSVLWNTNTIGLVDESAVQMGLKHYLFKFPNASANSTHILGFRLDPFTNALSSVIVTNVTLGQVGVSQPFTLTMTTNMHSELRVLQLQGQSDFTYTVEASTNLVNWKNIAVLVNTNGTVPFVDLESTNNNQRFYRAVAP